MESWLGTEHLIRILPNLIGQQFPQKKYSAFIAMHPQEEEKNLVHPPCNRAFTELEISENILAGVRFCSSFIW